MIKERQRREKYRDKEEEIMEEIGTKVRVSGVFVRGRLIESKDRYKKRK